MSKEQTLWRSVLAQAITDHVKGIDESYISLDNKDFLTVCGFASLSPASVIERAYMFKKGILTLPKSFSRSSNVVN
jgi:hypothetical protein